MLLGFYLQLSFPKGAWRSHFFIIIGYLLCLVISFIKLPYDAYGLIMVFGIILQIPVFESIRKMSLRLMEIEKSIGKDSYNYFINKVTNYD